MQVLSGWDALQCMAVVLASRRVDATANGYSKRGTVETIYIGKVLVVYNYTSILKISIKISKDLGMSEKA